MSSRWKKTLHAAAGLAVEETPAGQCKRCGACCAFISIPPFRDDELDELPADIRQVVEWYTRNDRNRPQSPTPCYFYDVTNRACLIQEHKPQMCQDFQPGGLACRKERNDLLGPLNRYRDATQQWAKHYTRVVAPGERIQKISEFSLEDDVPPSGCRN
jgi:Fe-S-cluster containining protein